jgi:CRP-like cAMP-binding protein
LSRDVILRLARESPDVGLRVLTMMGRRVKQSRGRIEQLSYKSAGHSFPRLAKLPSLEVQRDAD